MMPPSTTCLLILVTLTLGHQHHLAIGYRYWDHYNGVVTASTAQNMDDLQLVLGPKYRLMISRYWMYFTSTCDVIKERLVADTQRGQMTYFCPYVTKCPVLSTYQSCMVREVVVNIRQACCDDIANKNMGNRNVVTHAPYVTYKTANPGQKGILLNGQRTCNTGSILPTKRVIDGTSASRGEFPWVAMLLINGKSKCACTILDATHALTAAHCFENLNVSDRLEVLAGKYITDVNERDPGQQRVYVSAHRAHGQYQSITAEKDIAIIRLASPLQWSSTVMPVCLPPPGDTPADRCTVVGWGDTDKRDLVTKYPIVQQKVSLKTYSRNECLRTFGRGGHSDLRNYVKAGTMCAANGVVGGKDACKGDSGGPLLCIKGTKTSLAYFQFGIVSNGNQCATPMNPGVYTDVTYYLDWIRQTVNSLS